MDEAVRAHQAATDATKAANDCSDALRSSWYAAERQLKQVQQQINGIKEAGRSKAAQFGGRPMQALVTAVQRAKADFSRPPIGPVGQYLTLQDGRYAAIEIGVLAVGQQLLEDTAEQSSGGGSMAPVAADASHASEASPRGLLLQFSQCCDDHVLPCPAVLLPLLLLTLRRWGLAVEAAIRYQLEAFLVHTMEDSHRLRQLVAIAFRGERPASVAVVGVQITAELPLSTSPPSLANSQLLHSPGVGMRKICVCVRAGEPWRPNVYVVNFDFPVHSVPDSQQPPASLPTLLRLLSCTDSKLAGPIMNNLIDQAHIGESGMRQLLVGAPGGYTWFLDCGGRGGSC